MTTINEKFTIQCKGNNDIIDITQKIENIISINDIKNGLLNLSLISSNGAIITMEYDNKITQNIPKILENFIPLEEKYKNQTKEEIYSYVKTLIMGKNLIIPIVNEKLQIASWQKIILIDFDLIPNKKEIIATIIN